MKLTCVSESVLGFKSQLIKHRFQILHIHERMVLEATANQRFQQSLDLRLHCALENTYHTEAWSKPWSAGKVARFSLHESAVACRFWPFSSAGHCTTGVSNIARDSRAGLSSHSWPQLHTYRDSNMITQPGSQHTSHAVLHHLLHEAFQQQERRSFIQLTNRARLHDAEGARQNKAGSVSQNAHENRHAWWLVQVQETAACCSRAPIRPRHQGRPPCRKHAL